MISPLFNDPNADLVLRSAPSPESVDFLVHRCILKAASPFFSHMFTLPQPVADDATSAERPVINVSEDPETLNCLLQFTYPHVANPVMKSLDEFVLVLHVAEKYDMFNVTNAVAKAMVESPYAQQEPVRVFAIAMYFDLEDEARIASRYTLNVNLDDDPLFPKLDEMARIRLRDLHDRRSQAAQQLLKIPDSVKCMLCNGTHYGVLLPPKWWKTYEEMAKKELELRPKD